MAASPAGFDAHEQPSDEMRAEWKAVSRLDQHLVAEDPRIDDPRLPCAAGTSFRPAGRIDRRQLASAFEHLHPELAALADDHAPVLFHPLLPGLLIAPNLIPPPVQKSLLAKMLHRDLSNPAHQTNMHLHYALPYPPLPPDPPSPPRSRSFFSLAPDSAPCFVPKDPGVHKPLTPRQVLDRRLHWLTLGGQYDWTNRAYPDQQPPKFPADLAGFLEELFPETQAQAAIVNFYSPGDTMMMHRDVSEDTDKGLVSLSFGCDCLFMIAPSGSPGQADGGGSCVAGPGGKQYLLLRLRSGDAVYMTRESRYAWHGVPKVIKGTCPDYLGDWPAENGQYAEWKGWMKNKRINLNVRQMTE